MRLQIASDLHLEYRNPRESRHGPLEFAASDVLILAGDIDRIDRVSADFSDWPCPVLYVRGNHDSYFTSYEIEIRRLAAQASNHEFRFLERDEARFVGTRVLGCCLWTDFALLGRIEDALLLARYAGADYRCLRRADGVLLGPEDTLFEHKLTVDWLDRKLRQPFSGRTIVVSHHAPHIRSLDRRYGRNRFDAGFASNLSELMSRVDLWIHGHIHTSCDYKVRKCRVICNPAGYPAKPNPEFKPTLVVEV